MSSFFDKNKIAVGFFIICIIILIISIIISTTHNNTIGSDPISSASMSSDLIGGNQIGSDPISGVIIGSSDSSMSSNVGISNTMGNNQTTEVQVLKSGSQEQNVEIKASNVKTQGSTEVAKPAVTEEVQSPSTEETQSTVNEEVQQRSIKETQPVSNVVQQTTNVVSQTTNVDQQSTNVVQQTTNVSTPDHMVLQSNESVTTTAILPAVNIINENQQALPATLPTATLPTATLPTAILPTANIISENQQELPLQSVIDSVSNQVLLKKYTDKGCVSYNKDYVFCKFYDSEYNDIMENVGSIDEHLAKCKEIKECVALNTNGWIKSKINEPTQWVKWTGNVNEGLFLKKNPAIFM